MITAATTGSGIEIENHFMVGLFQHGIKQSAQVLFGCLGRYLQAVYLETTDAIFLIKSDNGLRIFLPIGKIILYAGIEP